MSIFSPHLFCWSIVIHNREFLISVNPDGSSEWLEIAAQQKAGGEQNISDFIGSIMGDKSANKRFQHRVDEFKIHTNPMSNDLEFITYAAANHDTPESDIDSAVDSYFFKQFWSDVNAKLPDQIKKA